MMIKSYPESVYESIFGTKKGWAKLAAAREEAVELVENMYSTFLKAEEARDDKEEKTYYEPALLQQIYELHFKQFKSYEEMAEDLDMDKDSVRAVVAYILRKMRYPGRCRPLTKFVEKEEGEVIYKKER